MSKSLYRINYEESVYFETFIEAKDEDEAKDLFRKMMEASAEQEGIIEPVEIATGVIDVEVVDERTSA